MKTTHKAFPFKHLIVMDASGTLDLAASQAALAKLAADPCFDSHTEVLLDMRDVECVMSTTDVYRLAEILARPHPALPTTRRIAILVAGQSEFDHAMFLETCAKNRGMRLSAFDDYDKASTWLAADLPVDPKGAIVA